MVLLLATRTASALCSGDLAVEPPSPGIYVAWPTRDVPGHVDTIVVVSRFDGGALGELLLRNPDGDEVEARRYDLTSSDGSSWAVFDPLANLHAGEHTVEEVDGFDTADFDMGGTLSESGGPLIPVWRYIESEVTWKDWDCPEEATTGSQIQYRLCNAPALMLVSVGESEPEAPSLEEPGDFLVLAGDDITLTDGLSSDLSTTVWLGGFDTIGRFTGWTADGVQMPPAGTITQERAEGASGDASCPANTVWKLSSSKTCKAWSRDTDNCLGPRLCSCNAAPEGAGSLLPALVAWLASVRRTRRDRLSNG